MAHGSFLRADFLMRLDELRNLQHGWLQGKGVAPSREGLAWFAQAFEQHFPDDLPLPFLYPTAEGGVQAEWSLGPHEVTLEVDLETHTGAWHALNLETDAEQAHELSLDAAEDWNWIAAQVHHRCGDSE